MSEAKSKTKRKSKDAPADGEATEDTATKESEYTWQSATDELFRSGVAEATGREVVAAISGFHPERGMASEVFVLAPE